MNGAIAWPEKGRLSEDDLRCVAENLNRKLSVLRSGIADVIAILGVLQHCQNYPPVAYLLAVQSHLLLLQSAANEIGTFAGVDGAPPKTNGRGP